jgi:hypothetical protein
VVVGDWDALGVGDSDWVGVGCAVADTIEHNSIIAVAVANLIIMSPVWNGLGIALGNQCLEHRVPLPDVRAMNGDSGKVDPSVGPLLSWILGRSDLLTLPDQDAHSCFRGCGLALTVSPIHR